MRDFDALLDATEAGLTISHVAYASTDEADRADGDAELLETGAEVLGDLDDTVVAACELDQGGCAFVGEEKLALVSPDGDTYVFELDELDEKFKKKSKKSDDDEEDDEDSDDDEDDDEEDDDDADESTGNVRIETADAPLALKVLSELGAEDPKSSRDGDHYILDIEPKHVDEFVRRVPTAETVTSSGLGGWTSDVLGRKAAKKGKHYGKPGKSAKQKDHMEGLDEDEQAMLNEAAMLVNAPTVEDFRRAMSAFEKKRRKYAKPIDTKKGGARFAAESVVLQVPVDLSASFLRITNELVAEDPTVEQRMDTVRGMDGCVGIQTEKDLALDLQRRLNDPRVTVADAA